MTKQKKNKKQKQKQRKKRNKIKLTTIKLNKFLSLNSKFLEAQCPIAEAYSKPFHVSFEMDMSRFKILNI